VFGTKYTGRNFFRNISCLFRSVLNHQNKKVFETTDSLNLRTFSFSLLSPVLISPLFMTICVSWSLEVLTLSLEYVCEIHKYKSLLSLKVFCAIFFQMYRFLSGFYFFGLKELINIQIYSPKNYLRVIH
jgi:hypothetical protein